MVDVSVIIPTYNRLWSLPRAVDSCRGSRCRTEIIVIDDGSTDDTAAWLREQADLIVLTQPNQGQTWAVNRGTARAAGTYLRFLDSDDFLAPGAIDLQLEQALATQADLVYGRVDTFLEKEARAVPAPDLPFWDDFLSVQLGGADGSHFLGMLFHRKLIEQVPRRPDFSFREDRMLLLEIGLLKPKLALTPGCTGYWTKHASQMHDTYRGLQISVAYWQHLQIYRTILGELARRGELTPARKKASLLTLWQITHEIAKTHPGEAGEIIRWVASLSPGSPCPFPGQLGRLYRTLGFTGAQKVLRLRRGLLGR